MLFWIGIAGVAVLVASWLFVSFRAPGRVRGIAAWLGAVGLYVAFLCFFLHLSHGAWEAGQKIRLGAFGFLTLLFASGLCLASFRLARELAGRGGTAQASATN